MTAVVLSENEADLEVDTLGTQSNGDEEDDQVDVQVKKVVIGDGKLFGRLVSVKCPDVGA